MLAKILSSKTVISIMITLSLFNTTQAFWSANSSTITAPTPPVAKIIFNYNNLKKYWPAAIVIAGVIILCVKVGVDLYRDNEYTKYKNKMVELNKKISSNFTPLCKKTFNLDELINEIVILLKEKNITNFNDYFNDLKNTLQEFRTTFKNYKYYWRVYNDKVSIDPFNGNKTIIQNLEELITLIEKNLDYIRTNSSYKLIHSKYSHFIKIKKNSDNYEFKKYIKEYIREQYNPSTGELLKFIEKLNLEIDDLKACSNIASIELSDKITRTIQMLDELKDRVKKSPKYKFEEYAKKITNEMANIAALASRRQTHYISPYMPIIHSSYTIPQYPKTYMPPSLILPPIIY